MPTTFRPDTCECAIIIEPDAAATGTFHGVPDGHRLVSVLERCPAHAALADAALYQAVREENIRKNVLVQEALEADGITPAQRQEIAELEADAGQLGIPVGFLMTPVQLQRHIRMKAFTYYAFSYTPARVLTASFPNLKPPMTLALKAQVQARADARFGPGKVLMP